MSLVLELEHGRLSLKVRDFDEVLDVADKLHELLPEQDWSTAKWSIVEHDVPIDRVLG